MRGFSFSRLSLLWKILLSTSVAITGLFAVTGWIVEKNALDTTARSLEEEVQASFHAYRSLWQSRLSRLASVSLILSQMSDVRKAFGKAIRRPSTIPQVSVVQGVRRECIVSGNRPRGRLAASPVAYRSRCIG